MSSTEGKSWIAQRVAALAADGPLSVLDVGPGVGTYAKLLAGPHVSRIVGLEVWEPYVRTYRLHSHYDEIIVGDVRQAELPEVDVVILGDIVEHMTRDEALQVWTRCCQVARQAIFLSIPIVHYPQHEIEGNPYEVHVEADWDHEGVLSSFAGIGAWELGSEVGVYECRTG